MPEWYSTNNPNYNELRKKKMREDMKGLEIIKNAYGRYEIRRSDQTGRRFDYYDKDYDGGTWWSERYRKHSTKFWFKDNAIIVLERMLNPRIFDQVVYSKEKKFNPDTVLGYKYTDD